MMTCTEQEAQEAESKVCLQKVHALMHQCGVMAHHCDGNVQARHMPCVTCDRRADLGFSTHAAWTVTEIYSLNCRHAFQGHRISQSAPDCHTQIPYLQLPYHMVVG